MLPWLRNIVLIYMIWRAAKGLTGSYRGYQCALNDISKAPPHNNTRDPPTLASKHMVASHDTFPPPSYSSQGGEKGYSSFLSPFSPFLSLFSFFLPLFSLLFNPFSLLSSFSLQILRVHTFEISLRLFNVPANSSSGTQRYVTLEPQGAHFNLQGLK